MNKWVAGTLLTALVGASACTVDSVSTDDSYDTEACPSCASSDYHLRVTADPGLGARMTLIYQSTEDSFGCTDLEWDMLNPKRVPEQVRVELQAAATAEGGEGELVYDFAFQHDLGDGCASQIRHIYLEPTDRAEQAEPWASLSFVDSEDYDDELQVVECSTVNGVVNCGNDLLRHTVEGRAQVQLIGRD